jgi:hypothetical protein
MAALRFDLVFSYWIFVWFILYLFKLTKYSPKFALILALLENTIMLILMFLYGTSIKTIIYFIIINTLIKLLPLYYLREERIKIRDIYFTAFLFVLFILWLSINKQSLTGNLKTIYNSLLYGKNETPFMSLLTNIKKYYKTLEVI